MPTKNYPIEMLRTVRERLHKSIQNKSLEHRILAVVDFTSGHDSATLTGSAGTLKSHGLRSAKLHVAKVTDSGSGSAEINERMRI